MVLSRSLHHRRYILKFLDDYQEEFLGNYQQKFQNIAQSGPETVFDLHSVLDH